MTPTWYDILGVEPDATPEQIKAAWRDSTDKFEPGSGGARFRMFNEAADVLLDPQKRRAYDAELADRAAPAEVVAAPGEALVAAPEPVPETTSDTVPAAAPATGLEPPTGNRLSAAVSALSSTFGLAILGVLAAAAVILAVFLAADLNERADDAARSADSFNPEDGTAASSVAERAVAAVLAYDYRNMAADRDRALTFLTPEYQKTYEKIFDGLINGTEQAPGGAIKTKAVVSAEVLSTAVVDADENTARVLVFVNQQPTTNGKQQALLSNRVVATMVLRDGTWLLDKLDPLSAGF